MYRFVKVCNGTVRIAFDAVSIAAIGIGIGKIRFQFYRFVKVCNGTVKITLVEVSSPTIVIGYGIIGT